MRIAVNRSGSLLPLYQDEKFRAATLAVAGRRRMRKCPHGSRRSRGESVEFLASTRNSRDEGHKLAVNHRLRWWSAVTTPACGTEKLTDPWSRFHQTTNCVPGVRTRAVSLECGWYRQPTPLQREQRDAVRLDNVGMTARRNSRSRRFSHRRDRGDERSRTGNRSLALVEDRRWTANAVSYAAETRQARYFKAVLDDRRAKIVEEIAEDSAAVKQCDETGDLRAVRRMRRRLAQKRRQQFELDRLHEALQQRFFSDGEPTLAKAIRCFDVVIARKGSGWRVHIPELDEVLTNIDRRAEAEILARSHIAAVIGTPMVEIAVHIVDKS